MKSNLNDLNKLISYLQAFRLPVLIENISKLSNGEDAYENYQAVLDCILIQSWYF
jgi:hypothetical protein